MTQTAYTIATCSRCGGTGKFSFNLRDMDTCLKCGGTGKMLRTPKGQPKVAPTATRDTAQPGDIIEEGQVLFRVHDVSWIGHSSKLSQGDRYQQFLRLVRLVDNAACCCARPWYATVDGKLAYVQVPDALHAQPVTPETIAQVTAEGVQK